MKLNKILLTLLMFQATAITAMQPGDNDDDFGFLPQDPNTLRQRASTNLRGDEELPHARERRPRRRRRHPAVDQQQIQMAENRAMLQRFFRDHDHFFLDRPSR